MTVKGLFRKKFVVDEKYVEPNKPAKGNVHNRENIRRNLIYPFLNETFKKVCVYFTAAKHQQLYPPPPPRIYNGASLVVDRILGSTVHSRHLSSLKLEQVFLADDCYSVVLRQKVAYKHMCLCGTFTSV